MRTTDDPKKVKVTVYFSQNEFIQLRSAIRDTNQKKVSIFIRGIVLDSISGILKEYDGWKVSNEEGSVPSMERIIPKEVPEVNAVVDPSAKTDNGTRQDWNRIAVAARICRHCKEVRQFNDNGQCITCGKL